MRLVWQWAELERGLPAGWADARLVLTVADRDADRAAGLLGGANPLRQGSSFRLFVARGGAFGPDAMRRALLRLDRANVDGTLELDRVTETEAPVVVAAPSLAGSWDDEIAKLPADWSDLYAELALRSSDHLERAALLAAPLNPLRAGKAVVLRFRVARRFGYGTSPTMARRCLERLDEERIPGRLEILRVLCDTDAVGTQGPVWRVGGRSV